MKILTGRYRNRRIKSPTNSKLRPTLNIIRSAIFDIAQHHIDFQSSLFIDAFAGSGAVGLEALSRGFQYSIFIEKDRRYFYNLKANLEFLPPDSFIAINTDFFRYLKNNIVAKTENWSQMLIFADPPYIEGFFSKFFDTLASVSFENKSCYLALQAQTDFELPCLRNQSILQEKVYGNNKLIFYDL